MITVYEIYILVIDIDFFYYLGAPRKEITEIIHDFAVNVVNDVKFTSFIIFYFFIRPILGFFNIIDCPISCFPFPGGR